MYGLYGKVLRSCRKQAKKSQDEVAQAMGVTVAMVSFVESGKKQTADEPTQELAQLLDADFDYLLAAYRLSRPVQLQLQCTDRAGRRFWYHQLGKLTGLPITLDEFDRMMVDHVDPHHLKGTRKK